MTVFRLTAELQRMMRLRPEAADFRVVVAADAEGNSFRGLSAEIKRSLGFGHYIDRGWLGGDLADEETAPEAHNAVVLWPT
jgi:hypothetical protein